MWSKKQEKIIRSLKQKKFRKQYGLFVAEGLKTVGELLKSELSIEGIYATASTMEQFHNPHQVAITEISEAQMKSISSLSEPPGLLALAKIPSQQLSNGELIVFLEEVRDPGNLGTIIRSCEGFGVSQLVLSPNCVDPYSQKVVQASMGAIFRLPVVFDTLDHLRSKLEPNHHFFAADMQGSSIYEASIDLPAVLIMGGESNGLSSEVRNSPITQLSIPMSDSLESLNVGVSTAIILSEIRRRFPL